MNKEELKCYHKIFSIINKTDLLNFDERDELHLFLIKLKEENEKLNHYKLLYQKVKERNTEAIEYNKALAKLYDIGSMERSNADTNLLILGDEETIRISKGNNESK